jgi:chorismate mutase/prephenate dehydratase
MGLDELRNKIDNIDDQLLSLFEERMDIVSEIAVYKQANGLSTLDSGREAEKLRALSGKINPNLEPLAQTLFITLFELSRSYQDIVR